MVKLTILCLRWRARAILLRCAGPKSGIGYPGLCFLSFYTWPAALWPAFFEFRHLLIGGAGLHSWWVGPDKLIKLIGSVDKKGRSYEKCVALGGGNNSVKFTAGL